MAEIIYVGTLIVRTCWCGIKFALPDTLNWQYEQRNKESIYCPLGHSMVPANDKIEELNRQLRIAEAQTAAQRDRAAMFKAERDRENRRANTFKGVATRTKKRIANGVCPCCNRTFQDLMRHMTSKHPHYEKSAAGKE